MKVTRLFAIALVALGVCLAAPTAHALTFTFADSGAILPGSSVSCYNGDDVCGTTLTWTQGLVSVTASGLGTPPTGSTKAVIQDLYPNDGGLGVVNKSAAGAFTGDDEVNFGETLLLTFNQSVTLDGVTFFDKDHGALSSVATFLFAVDGGLFTEHEFSAPFADSGTTFAFQFGGEKKIDFYVASVDVAPVPEPGTLLLLGSGITGLAMRRRRNRK